MDTAESRPVLRPPTVGDWLVVAGYAAVVVGTYVLGLALGVRTSDAIFLHETIYSPVLFPGLFVFAPPLVAVGNLLRGGTPIGSLLVGVVPGLAFGALALLADLLGMGAGDSPLWAMILTFGGIGFLGAAAGVASYLAVDRVARRVT